MLSEQEVSSLDSVQTTMGHLEQACFREDRSLLGGRSLLEDQIHQEDQLLDRTGRHLVDRTSCHQEDPLRIALQTQVLRTRVLVFAPAILLVIVVPSNSMCCGS